MSATVCSAADRIRKIILRGQCGMVRFHPVSEEEIDTPVEGLRGGKVGWVSTSCDAQRSHNFPPASVISKIVDNVYVYIYIYVYIEFGYKRLCSSIFNSWQVCNCWGFSPSNHVPIKTKFTPVLRKTNIAMENGSFEDAFPIEHGGYAILVYQKGKWKHLNPQNSLHSTCCNMSSRSQVQHGFTRFLLQQPG